MRTPLAFKAHRLATAASTSRVMALSVISRIRLCGSRPASSRTPATSSASSSWTSRRDERLALTSSGTGRRWALCRARLGAGLGQDRAVDQLDEADLLGDGDEAVGLQES